MSHQLSARAGLENVDLTGKLLVRRAITPLQVAAALHHHHTGCAVTMVQTPFQAGFTSKPASEPRDSTCRVLDDDHDHDFRGPQAQPRSDSRQ